MRGLQSTVKTVIGAERRIGQLTVQVSGKADAATVETTAHGLEQLINQSVESLRGEARAAASKLSQEAFGRLDELSARLTSLDSQVHQLEAADLARASDKRYLGLFENMAAKLEKLEERVSVQDRLIQQLGKDVFSQADIPAMVDERAVKLRKDLLREMAKRTETKADASTLGACMDKVHVLETQLPVLTHSLAEVDKATKRDAEALKQLTGAVARSVDSEKGRDDRLSRFEGEVHDMRRAINGRVDELSREVGDTFEGLRERLQEEVAQLRQAVGACASAVQLADMARDLAPKEEVLHQLQGKAEVSVVQEVRESVREVRSAVLQAAADGGVLTRRMAHVEDALELKCNISDVHVLVDARPDTNQVNTALEAVNDAIAQCASRESVAALEPLVAHMDRLVRSEQVHGRWVWDSGAMVSGDRILWDALVATTAEHSFSWGRGTPEITCVAAGLYRVSLAIFTSPGDHVKVGLYVNSRAVECIFRDSAPPGRPASKPRKLATQGAEAFLPEPQHRPAMPWGGGDAAEMAIGARVDGPCTITFLCLLPNSRLSVSVSGGGRGASAFLEVKKILN